MAWPLHITPFESSKNIQDRCLSFIAGACCKDTQRHPAHVGAQPAVAIWRLDCGWMHDAFNGDCHGGVQKAWHFTTFTGTPVGASSEICTCWFWFVSFILFHCATASFCVGPVFSTLVALWPGDAKADNCVRENKNNTVLKWACYMVAAGKLDLCSALFSRVGHTHGSLGVWDCTLWVWFRELFPRVFQTIWMESFDSALSSSENCFGWFLLQLRSTLWDLGDSHEILRHTGRWGWPCWDSLLATRCIAWLLQTDVRKDMKQFVYPFLCNIWSFQLNVAVSEHCPFLRKVHYMLHRIGIRSWVGDQCQIKVEYIDSVRDWKGWFLASNHWISFLVGVLSNANEHPKSYDRFCPNVCCIWQFVVICGQGSTRCRWCSAEVWKRTHLGYIASLHFGDNARALEPIDITGIHWPCCLIWCKKVSSDLVCRFLNWMCCIEVCLKTWRWRLLGAGPCWRNMAMTWSCLLKGMRVMSSWFRNRHSHSLSSIWVSCHRSQRSHGHWRWWKQASASTTWHCVKFCCPKRLPKVREEVLSSWFLGLKLLSVICWCDVAVLKILNACSFAQLCSVVLQLVTRFVCAMARGQLRYQICCGLKAHLGCMHVNTHSIHVSKWHQFQQIIKTWQ